MALPDSTTSSMGTSIWADICPRVAKMINPQKILVKKSPSTRIPASLETHVGIVDKVLTILHCLLNILTLSGVKALG